MWFLNVYNEIMTHLKLSLNFYIKVFDLTYLV